MLNEINNHCGAANVSTCVVLHCIEGNDFLLNLFTSSARTEFDRSSTELFDGLPEASLLTQRLFAYVISDLSYVQDGGTPLDVALVRDAITMDNVRWDQVTGVLLSVLMCDS